MAGLPEEVQGLLLDVDGVLTRSWSPLPGAVEGLAGIRRAGFPLRLVTNTTVLTAGELASVLIRAGFDVRREDLITAPVATGEYLRRHGLTACHLLGPESLWEDLGVAPATGRPDAVVVAGADPSFTWEELNRTLGMLLEGAALVAMHRNLTWTTDEGVKLDAGAFVWGLEQASGVRAVTIGKPSADFFRLAVSLLGLPAGRVAMVGDDPVTDVRAAQDLGMKGVLVASAGAAFAATDVAPDLRVESLAELAAVLGGPP